MPSGSKKANTTGSSKTPPKRRAARTTKRPTPPARKTASAKKEPAVKTAKKPAKATAKTTTTKTKAAKTTAKKATTTKKTTSKVATTKAKAETAKKPTAKTARKKPTPTAGKRVKTAAKKETTPPPARARIGTTRKVGGKKTVSEEVLKKVLSVGDPDEMKTRIAAAKKRVGEHDLPKKWTKRLKELFSIGNEVMGIEEFRPGQAEALDVVLKGKDLLTVMPTGSGKSLLYQLPSLVLPGMTVVVSPLIALIKDQIDKMKKLGVAVCRVDSTITVRQRREMEALARAPGGKLLITTPERMADPEFRVFLRECAGNVGVSRFVVDEAHCVSQWGHDFRPAYLGLRKAIEDLDNPPILAVTATAPPHVRDDILHQLGIPDAKTITTSYDRPNLHYECIAVPGDDEKNKVLITLLQKLPKPGIVYCATVKAVDQLAEKLARHNIPVARYHGRLTKKLRDQEQQRFMARKSDAVMIATNAFGLGVDKHDIRYVLHYHVPGSLEAYAQEAGRAGRDGKPARCVLFFSPDDVAIQEYFLKGTYPTRRQVRAVYQTLEAWTDHDETPPTPANLALSARVGIARTKTVLSLLKDEGFVIEEEGDLFTLASPTPDPKALNEKAKQYEGRRVADRHRLDALLEYVGTPGCRSQIVLGYLGAKDPEKCGRCDNCLRSKDAAIAAAQNATALEDGVVRRLQEEDAVAGVPEQQRIIRARVIRIDTETPVESDGEEPPPEKIQQVEGDEFEDDEYDDDDEYEDDHEYEVDEIEQTAAALAEEGYIPDDSEITVLARKKVPKPPKKKKRLVEDEAPVKKKRKRRRRRKGVIPPKSAFTSPVLVKEVAAQPAPKRRKGKGRGKAPAVSPPLVEYVRGPMRINMAPVASANPNDPKPRAGKKKRKRTNGKKRRPPAAVATPLLQPSPSSIAAEASPAPAPKKKRRRRRKKRGDRAQTTDATNGDDITFFSVDTSTPAPNGANGAQKRRKRKRRRRGKGNRSGQTPAAQAPADSE